MQSMFNRVTSTNPHPYQPSLIHKWLYHFERNLRNRPEPDWNQPIQIDPHLQRKLVRSLEQFELGDGGGPASLIEHDAERFRGG